MRLGEPRFACIQFVEFNSTILGRTNSSLLCNETHTRKQRENEISLRFYQSGINLTMHRTFPEPNSSGQKEMSPRPSHPASRASPQVARTESKSLPHSILALPLQFQSPSQLFCKGTVSTVPRKKLHINFLSRRLASAPADGAKYSLRGLPFLPFLRLLGKAELQFGHKNVSPLSFLAQFSCRVFAFHAPTNGNRSIRRFRHYSYRAALLRESCQLSHRLFSSAMNTLFASLPFAQVFCATLCRRAELQFGHKNVSPLSFLSRSFLARVFLFLLG
jgi:hypothetical protein